MSRMLLFAGILFLQLGVYGQYNRGIISELLLKTDTTSIGQLIAYPSYGDVEITAMKITIPPGVSTGWHKHDFPVFAYIMEGTLTVESACNRVMQFPENSTFAEMIGTFHNGTNHGTGDVVLVAFYLGGKGVPLSVRKESPVSNEM